MGFERVPLGELVRLKRGYDLPRPIRRAGEVPVVSSRGISGRHDVARARAPGVVTGRTGTLGGVFFLETDFWPLNTTLFVTDFRDNDPRFVAYLLETIDFEAHNDKAAVPGVARGHLHTVEVPRPPPRTQRRIARALAPLDRRLALLARMDEHAKAMAETLFQLVPAGAPRHVEQLCCEIGNGYTPPRRDPAFWGGEIAWFRSGDLRDGPLLHAGETLAARAVERTACRVWPAGAVLIAMYAAPTVGRLGLLDAPAAANQACCALVARREYGGRFLFHALLATRDRLRRLAVGAVQQNVNQGLVRAHELAVPAPRVARAFSRRVAPLHRFRILYERERRALVALRAALLPELVSGRLAPEKRVLPGPPAAHS